MVSASLVAYPDVVAVGLFGLPKSCKKELWRARQVQNQAYNWGVEQGLTLHCAEEKIPSPRYDSTGLTLLRRHPENRGASLLLQRGGYWPGVNAAKKWSKHRRKAVKAFSESVDLVESTAGNLKAILAELEYVTGTERAAPVRDAAEKLIRHGDEYATAAVGLVNTLGRHPELAYHAEPAEMDSVEDIMSAFDERAEALLDVYVSTVEALRSSITKLKPANVEPALLRDTKKSLRGAVTKHSNAVKKLNRSLKPLVEHLCRGVARLFRSRKKTERCSSPALIFNEGCRIKDGHLVLPGKIKVRLPRDKKGKPFAVSDEMRWGGAAHVVDVTDLAGKVTRRTLPEHRKYKVHFLCESYASAPLEATDASQTVGADWGVENPLVCSDGKSYPKYASEQQGEQNRQRQHKARHLQRSMSAKNPGSRRHKKHSRRKKKLQQKNTNVKANQQRRNAKAVVTNPETRQLTVEDSRVKQMTGSAVGTKAFPATNSAGKRGLNKALAETAPSRMLSYLERASLKHSVGYQVVNPAYTSLTCFVCGNIGNRETQAVFHCSECNSYAHADVQAALNTNERGHPHLYPSVEDSPFGGRDSRRKTLDEALGVFLDSQNSHEHVTNKYAQPQPCGYSSI